MQTFFTKNVILAAVVALVVGLGAGYEGARALTKSPSQDAFTAGGSGFTRGGGTFTRGGNQAGAGFLSGTIASMDSGSITLNTRDGSSHVVLLTPDTTISKSVNGSTSDLAAGDTVMVSGTTNSDGSISATTVDLRPAGSPKDPGTNAPMIPAQ